MFWGAGGLNVWKQGRCLVWEGVCVCVCVGGGGTWEFPPKIALIVDLVWYVMWRGWGLMSAKWRDAPDAHGRLAGYVYA